MKMQPSPRTPLLVVSWFFDDQPGFLDFRYRVEALSRCYDVTLVLRAERFCTEFTIPGVNLCVLPQQGSGTRSLLAYIRQIASEARARRPAAVVLLGAQLAMAVYLLREMPVALYWNEHPTHTFHGGRWGWLSRALERVLVSLSFHAAKRSDLVMPIGEAHRDDLLSHGVDSTRCKLIYMGVHERFVGTRSVRTSGSSLALIYCGTVEAARGRDVMIDGLALARKDGIACNLTIVGASESQVDYCRRRASELGIADSLQVVGRVSGDEIPAYLREADAGICIWEDRVWWRFNPPTKLFEYLAAGLPVLASRIRTHTEYIEDGSNGMIFDYDPLSFCRAIVRLQAKVADLASISDAATASGRRFLWARIEPQFLAAIAVLTETPCASWSAVRSADEVD